jgi:hypothetical protein
VERSGVEVDHVHRNQVEKRSSACAVEQGPSGWTKASLRPKEVWAIRIRLQIKHSKRIGTIEEPSDRLDFRLGRHLTGSEGVEADNHDGVGVGDQCISSSGVLTPSSLTRS